MRAKFRCHSVEFHGKPENEETARTYTLSAVYDTSTPENERFTKATPWGDIKIRIDNPAARFEVGEYYYIDFTKVVEKPVSA